MNEIKDVKSIDEEQTEEVGGNADTDKPPETDPNLTLNNQSPEVVSVPLPRGMGDGY